MKYVFLILSLLCVCINNIYAQQTITKTVEYIYYGSENITPEQAKQNALERAKLQAIEEAFGSVVQQTTTRTLRINNGVAGTDFFSEGETEVKGEWIETIGEPEFVIFNEDNLQIVKVKVKGKIRERISANIDIEAKVLCNGTSSKFESENFKNGDDLFLNFHSPVDGFLAVYLVDSNQMANCLLPYEEQTDGAYAIKANKSYVFFSEKYADTADASQVVEYKMTTEHAVESNIIYVIFSTNHFSKASDTFSSEKLLQELPVKDFMRWLAKCRKTDIKMQVVKKTITVKK